MDVVWHSLTPFFDKSLDIDSHAKNYDRKKLTYKYYKCKK